MRYCKFIIVIGICFLMSLCANVDKKQLIPKNDISNALNSIISNVVNENPNYDDYRLIRKFMTIVPDSLMKEQILNMDPILNLENVNYMVEQYAFNKGDLVKPYLSDHYHDKLTDTLIYNQGLVCFEISLPLFSKDMNSFIINLTGYFKINSEKKWDSMYFFFSKVEDDWKLKGIIK